MRKMHRGRVQQPRLQYLSRSLIAGACLALLGTSAVLAAAPTSFPQATTTVKVTREGITAPLTGLGSQDQDQQLQNTVVFYDGKYYLWYQNGSTALKDLSLATSEDGVNFEYVGNFTPPVDGATPWYLQLDGLDNDPTVEPRLAYPRLQKVGNNWIMAIWNLNQTNLPSVGDYNYNTTLWNLGGNPGNLNPTQIGPLPERNNKAGDVRPLGPQHAGTFGIIGDGTTDIIYVRNDNSHTLGRYQLKGGATSSLPVTLPEGYGADVAPQMYDGTDWCHYADVTCTAADDEAYVHNYGRTLLDGGTLQTYYSLYDAKTGLRAQQQLWRVESTDGGTAWGQPQALFTDGSKVTVDGFPNTGNFSNPEVVPLGGGNYKSYFSTRDICGNWVMVTDPVPGKTPTMTIVKDFEQNEVAVNGESKLTVTVTAPPLPCSPAPEVMPKYTNISYTDNLPAGVEMVSTEGAGDSNECGGTLSSTPTSFTVAGFALAAGASCTTTVTVKPTRVGSFLNTIYKDPEAGDGGLDNDQGIPAADNATDTLRTPGAPMAVAPIPTLGEVSLGLLGLLMAGWGARSLRRRRD